MNEALSTRSRLLEAARARFWRRGYAQVGLREIAQAAGVDVAMIARHFGSKQGLFEATLEGAFDLGEAQDADALIGLFLEAFVAAPRGADALSPLRMLLVNAHDETVGPVVRAGFQDSVTRCITPVAGAETRAALFVSVLLGISVAEKSLHLQGIGQPDSPLYAQQIRHMLEAALAFDEDTAA